MQTFLPFAGFMKSAESLDRLRLGKQRVEAWQILRTLLGESTGWQNHPVVKAWKGYEGSLVAYGLAMCLEWKSRGYVDHMFRNIEMLADGHTLPDDNPPWLGGERVHECYRGLLVHKMPEHYVDVLGWTDEPIEGFDYELFGLGEKDEEDDDDD